MINFLIIKDQSLSSKMKNWKIKLESTKKKIETTKEKKNL